MRVAGKLAISVNESATDKMGGQVKSLYKRAQNARKTGKSPSGALDRKNKA